MAQFGYTVAGFGAGAEQGIVEIDVDAIEFNGSSSKIEYTNSFWRYIDPMNDGGGPPNAEGTFSMWLKPDAIFSAGSKPIMQIGSVDGTPSIRVAYNYSSGGVGGMYLEVEFIGSLNEFGYWKKYTTTIGSLTGNVWQHCAFAFTNGGITAFFIDGATVSSFGINGSGADTDPADTENTLIGYDGSTYGGFCLAELYIDQTHRSLSDMTDFITKVASPSTPTTKPSPRGKPVRIAHPGNNYFYLTGDSTTWANQGTNTLGTQTLSNITDCADSPSD